MIQHDSTYKPCLARRSVLWVHKRQKELLLNKHFYIFLWYSMVSCVLCLREIANDRVTITGYRCFKIVSRLTILERAVLISWELAPSQEITRLMKSTEHWAIGWRAIWMQGCFSILSCSIIQYRFASLVTQIESASTFKCINQNGQVHAPSHRVPIL